VIQPKTRFRALIFVFSVGVTSVASAQLRVATWNVTNWTENASAARTSAFQTAIFGSFNGRSMNPDVLVTQEMGNSASVDKFLAMLNSAPGQSGQWAKATPYLATGDTNSAMFYRTSKVNFSSLSNITGDPRDTQRYNFNLKGYQSGSAVNPNVALYSSHLKAGSGTGGADEQRRLLETTNIRTDAANLPAGTQFLIGGDFNISTSGDLSYKQLTDASVSRTGGAITGGRFFDPINSSFTSTGGNINWQSANSRFLHTQDPFGSGGMDDRFDFLLTGASLRDGKGLEYIGSTTAAYSTSTWNDPNHSYRVWGNDGTSYNSTLTVAGNTMVGPTIAQAIIDSVGSSNPNNVGGHLPVFLDMKIPADLTVNVASLQFGNVTQGSTSGLGVTVTNGVDSSIWGVDSVQNLNYSFSIAGSGFLAPTGTGNLLSGQSLESLIRIDTTTVGQKIATLNITDNVTGQVRSVALSGLVVVPEPATMVALGLGIAGFLRKRRKA
jgi:hypothetical protein